MTYIGPQVVNFRPSDDQAWTRQAVCADPEAPYMFPLESDAVGIQMAKDVCGPCPVRDACLSWALDRNETAGVWGGYSSEERQALRRRRARAATAADK